VDAEKWLRHARLDPEILRPISHRAVDQQEALTLMIVMKKALASVLHGRSGVLCAMTCLVATNSLPRKIVFPARP
jgi:hypothetical protein